VNQNLKIRNFPLKLALLHHIPYQYFLHLECVVLNTDAFALPHSDMNSFLFADIGTEREGMTLSVLSALSRLGIDPWQKAEDLARLPRAAAIDALAGLISTLPTSPWSIVDAMTIAARLVLLLPHHAAARPVAGPEVVADGWKWVSGVLPRGLLTGRNTAKAPTARQWVVVAVLLAGAIVAVILTLPSHGGATLSLAPAMIAAARLG
jgi:hypothetical protein